ncbi:unnamed protein product [Diamesa serratosioi]
MASTSKETTKCPVCSREFKMDQIEVHVMQCLEKQTKTIAMSTQLKRLSSNDKSFDIFNCAKKPKISIEPDVTSTLSQPNVSIPTADIRKKSENFPPLAEFIRPSSFSDYVGQKQVVSENSIIRNLLKSNVVPSMIFWGPPGCGKTTLAHIIANHCSQNKESMRFIKLSACAVGINEVKEVFKIAKSHQDKFKKKTILFMDEIHRFNKLQQDAFLPQVENGTIVLIGATTENPSFSLNSALLSRCRVIAMNKLETSDILLILKRALKTFKAVEIKPELDDELMKEELELLGFIPELAVQLEALQWIAEISDGDARIALNSLEIALQQGLADRSEDDNIKIISLAYIKDGIKRSHILYDRAGDQHYDLISALHKSIRASDENASLYWVTRMMVSGEDPKFICRRLIRAASEDIGLADPQALILATSTLQAFQFIGMPEADCIIAQLVVYLARAPKSTESYHAMKNCKAAIENHKGKLPLVPLHLRNVPTKLMANLGYGSGYNTLNKDESGLIYLPGELEDANFFDC